MNSVNDVSLRELLASSALKPGDLLGCDLPGIYCTACKEGPRLGDKVFTDPDAAMRHVLPERAASGSGWLFWHLPDPARSSIRPLAQLRTAFRASRLRDEVKTSVSHPLRIDSLVAPGFPGRLGMTFCPGKKGPALFGGHWDRDLGQDLEAIRRFGAGDLVTLLEPHEFGLLGVPEFAQAVTDSGLRWHWCPIRDSGVPDGRFDGLWPTLRQELCTTLASGGGVVVHCRGGLGRTGIVVGRLLVEAGLESEAAIALLRQTRPGALQTWAQEEHIRHWRALA